MPPHPGPTARSPCRGRGFPDDGAADAARATRAVPLGGPPAGSAANPRGASAGRTAAVQAGRAGARCSCRDVPSSSGPTVDAQRHPTPASGRVLGRGNAPGSGGRRACGGSPQHPGTGLARSRLAAVPHRLGSSRRHCRAAMGLELAKAKSVPDRAERAPPWGLGPILKGKSCLRHDRTASPQPQTKPALARFTR